MADKYAKPCQVCGGYYPGDCKCDQETCMCDGCQSLRYQNQCECDSEHLCDLCLLQEDD
jgi:hypothetical protein